MNRITSAKLHNCINFKSSAGLLGEIKKNSDKLLKKKKQTNNLIHGIMVKNITIEV
jgi:hypothetical protein